MQWRFTSYGLGTGNPFLWSALMKANSLNAESLGKRNRTPLKCERGATPKYMTKMCREGHCSCTKLMHSATISVC